MFIYKITGPTGKSYIGASSGTIEKRMREHKSFMKTGRKYPLHEDMRKYGYEAFKVEILEIIETKEKLLEKEEYWIRFYNSKENGYNLNYGTKGFKHSEKQRKANSIRSKKRAKKLGKKYYSELSKNMWMNKEIRQKLIISAKNRSNIDTMRKIGLKGIEARNKKRIYIVKDKSGNLLLRTHYIKEVIGLTGLNGSYISRVAKGNRNNKKYIITRRHL